MIIGGADQKPTNAHEKLRSDLIYLVGIGWHWLFYFLALLSILPIGQSDEVRFSGLQPGPILITIICFAVSQLPVLMFARQRLAAICFSGCSIIMFYQLFWFWLEQQK
jgi:hypothetical protein